MSTPRRTTRRTTNTTPQATATATAKPAIIYVNDTATSSRVKRSRTTNTPKRSSGHTTRKSTRISTGKGTPQSRTKHPSSDDEDESSSSSSPPDILSSVLKTIDATPSKGFIHRTPFDAYFASASKSARTSSNVFSELVPPITRAEYTALIPPSPPLLCSTLPVANTSAHPFRSARNQIQAQVQTLTEAHTKLFPRYALELSEGFNLIFFGFGSKYRILTSFALTHLAPRGNLVILNGFDPTVTIKNLLDTITALLPTSIQPSPPSPHDIYTYFLPAPLRPPNTPSSPHPLFILIHNIDAPALRTPKAKSILGLLALNPRIHIVGSIDHIGASTLWSASEMGARKHDYTEKMDPSETGSAYARNMPIDIPSTCGFAWVWHDLTTFTHYEVEIEAAHKGGRKGAVPLGSTTSGTVKPGGDRISEAAVKHVLASVNVKARRLFMLLASMVLDTADVGEQHDSRSSLHTMGIPATTLFTAARADFIATSDTAFRALLAEFRDHGIIGANRNNDVGDMGGEMLYIPMRIEELKKVLKRLQEGEFE